MVSRGSSSGSSYRYNDAWIKTKFGTVDEAIKKAKSFDNYIYKTGDPEYSFDPEIPFQIRRKGQRFQYMMFSLMVTNKSTEKSMNEMGAYGWYTGGMGIVNEKSGTAPFLFQLQMIGDKTSPIKFEYKCFQYEISQGYLLQDKINKLNKSGFEFIQTSAWNKTHSFVLLSKVIY
jgi:hypothetical protein